MGSFLCPNSCFLTCSGLYHFSLMSCIALAPFLLRLARFLLVIAWVTPCSVTFVSKAINRPLAKYASLVMSGRSLSDIDFTAEVIPRHVSVKEAVLPFEKFQGCDVLLGPEMRSTGEVMGIDFNFSMAFAKAQVAAGQKLPTRGAVFLSLNDLTKHHPGAIRRGFKELGFRIVATSGMARVLELKVVEAERVLKLHEGRPDAGDMVSNGEVQLLVITSLGDESDSNDGKVLRRLALAHKIPIITTIVGALASVEAMKSLRNGPMKMLALQDFFGGEEREEALGLKEVGSAVGL